MQEAGFIDYWWGGGGGKHGQHRDTAEDSQGGSRVPHGKRNGAAVSLPSEDRSVRAG